MRKFIITVICLSLLAIPATALAASYEGSFIMPDQADEGDVKFHVKNGNIYIQNHANYPVMFFSCLNVSACSFKKYGKQFPENCTMWDLEDGVPIDGKFFRNISHWDCYILEPGERTTLYVHSCYTNFRFIPKGYAFLTFTSSSQWEKFTKVMRQFNREWRVATKMYFR